MNDEQCLVQEMSEIISHGWCRRAQATDAEGFEVTPRHPRAVKFCIMGAFELASRGDEGQHTNRVYDRLQVKAAKRGAYSVCSFNDCVCVTSKDALVFLREVYDSLLEYSSPEASGSLASAAVTVLPWTVGKT
jgi:hypothetical protein